MLWGIDISHYQGDLDLHRARREGFEYVIIKATEGHTYVDPWFARNLDKARNAGLLVAAYHYQRVESAAPWQADHIEKIVPKDVPLILDVEDGGGHIGHTRATYEYVLARGYHMPLLYLPEWYWQQLGRPNLSGLPPLWYSRYANYEGGYASEIWARNASWFDQFWTGYGGNHVEVLQFTSSATVAGHTPVDANAYRGTRDQMAALLAGGDTSASVPEEDDMAAIHDVIWGEHHQSRVEGSEIVLPLGAAILDNNAFTFESRQIIDQLNAKLDQLVARPPVDTEAIGAEIRTVVADELGEVNQEKADTIARRVIERVGMVLAGQENEQ